MRDRISVVRAAGVVVGALGLCCGLPVLLSLGFLGALAGISLGSWVLIALGLAIVGLAVWRRHEQRRRHPSPRPAQRGAPSRGEREDMGVRTGEGS